VPSIFLMKCSNNLSYPISFLFQLYFDNSFLNELWRQAYVTPAFNKVTPLRWAIIDQYLLHAHCVNDTLHHVMYVCYYVRIQCTLGNCESLLVLIIPGWDQGSRRLINITSMSRTEKVNTVLNTVPTATVIIIDNVTLYTQNLIISLIRNVYL